MPHKPRRLNGSRVRFPTEVEHPTCHGHPRWKAHSIKCPQRGGSLYQNYKGFHLIVLLVLVDGDYKFLWVDLGAAGSSSDAQIFKHSDLRHEIEDGTIGFPESESLVDDGPKVNYFILGDNAFHLKLWLMKPCSRHGMEPESV